MDIRQIWRWARLASRGKERTMEAKDRTAGGYETMVSNKEDVVIDTNKQGVGDAAKEKIASTARTLRDQGADKIASSATTLLKKGEDYLEGADMSPVRADIERMIKQYPIPAL